MKDFFISYNRHDKAWAEWIAGTLEEEGHSTVIQAWDFRAGGNFVLDMQQAATETKCTIAVLSETYLKSEFTAPEWAAAFAQDPTGKKRILIPVRVKECTPTGLLAQINYVDLVDLDETDAQHALVQAVSPKRPKPDGKLPFPGRAASSSDRPKPVFPPSIPCNLPPVSAIFVGREKELEELHTQLKTGDTSAISAISGMGGIGKTELAAQYALQQRDMGTYPGGICWLKAREDLNPQIVLFARSHLGLTIPEDLELPAQVTYCWRHWRPGMTLLVFDDVQAYNDVTAVAIPQRSQFRVLLTTRLKFQPPVHDFEIKKLPEGKAIELLRAIVPDGRIDQDLETTKEICHWLGYLPLGLELVGRYLARKPGTSLATLWQRLQDKKLDAKALKDAAPEMTAALGVAAAFELSWQELDESAQTLAVFLSLFALAEIPWTLVEACYPEEDAEAVEDVRDESLLNLHLLERSGEGTYQLHQLLREFFAAKRSQRTDTAGMEQAFRGAVLAEAERSTKTPARSLLAETTVLMPHLHAVVQLSETSGQETDVAVDLAWLAALYTAQGRYTQAEPLYTRARTIYEHQLGADHPDVAKSLNNLANLYRAQGRYEEAEPLYVQALKIGEQQLGSDHPDVATRLNNLANLYRAQGRYREAEPLFQRALEIGEQQLGADHPDVATRLNNLANLYRAQGRYREAESLYVQALEIGEQQLGADHPDVATRLNNLAGLYHDQGRYEEAEPLFQRALEISEQQLGADHPDIATRLNNLANLYRAQGRYEEAEPLFQRALEIGEQQLGADHPDVATSLNNLANLYHDQGRYGKAEPLFQRALEIGEQQLGADHPDVATRLNNLANLYHDQGRYGEAESLYVQALEISEQQLGADHPDVATSLNNLANPYHDQGRYGEAEPLFQRALEIGEQQLGADHPDVATWLNNLANLYRTQGRYGESESLFQRALEILVSCLGTNHPHTRTVHNSLAGLYDVMAADFKLQGRYDQVAAYLEKARTLHSQLLQ
ncbi:MAG: tetratricopeptide repeat protein [Leptolyngbya sp. BL-A-14]